MEETLKRLAEKKGFRMTVDEGGKNYKYVWLCLLQKWLRGEHKLMVWVSYDGIDDAESAFVWNVDQYIPNGIEGSRKKDDWDFHKRHCSFSERHMSWYQEYESALEEGLKQALKLIE